MDIFQRLNAERGITVLLVTHERTLPSTAPGSWAFRDGRIVRTMPVRRRRRTRRDELADAAFA